MSIFISIIALILAMLSWHKSRAIYDIEKYKFPKRVGESKTENDKNHEQALKEKLKSGKWQILHIYDYSNDELMIVLGRIRERFF